MKKGFLSVCTATLLAAAAPYSDAQLANGFAQFVTMGRDVSPLTSAAIPDSVTANLKALEGCKVIVVESLASKQVDYVVEWKCKKKLAEGLKTAVMLKIVEGRISEIIMAEQVGGPNG